MSSTTTTVLGKRQRSHFVLQVSAITDPSHVPKSLPIIVNGTLVDSGTKKRYQCTHPGCLKAYTKPSRLNEHERSHTGQRPFSCDQCSKSFLRESHLHAHARSHLPNSDRPFSCEESNCDKRFWTAQHLRAHTEWHSGTKPFVCPEENCDQAFAKHHQLRTHRSTVHAIPGTKPYQCEHDGCAKSFSTSQHLRTHSKVHDEKRYTCANPVCLAGGNLTFFPTWTALQQHSRTAHPPTCNHVSCNGRTFSSQKGLRGHLKLHEQQDAEAEFDGGLPSDSENPPRKKRRGGEFGRDWKCDVEDCNKDFKSQKALTTHVNITHLGRRDFACSYENCGQSFGYKHILQRHIAKHHAAPSEPPPSEDEDEEPQSGVVAEADIGTITGDNYAQSARQKLAAATALPCPYPDLSGLQPELEHPVRDHASTASTCEYVFSRAYDLRRHLQAAHNLVFDKEVVQRWVRRAKETAPA
ncbi:transcription factor iiia [Mycena amicta]|nr:transcription factor iiia [Mycena amicta]